MTGYLDPRKKRPLHWIQSIICKITCSYCKIGMEQVILTSWRIIVIGHTRMSNNVILNEGQLSEWIQRNSCYTIEHDLVNRDLRDIKWVCIHVFDQFFKRFFYIPLFDI